MNAQRKRAERMKEENKHKRKIFRAENEFCFFFSYIYTIPQTHKGEITIMDKEHRDGENFESEIFEQKFFMRHPPLNAAGKSL